MTPRPLTPRPVNHGDEQGSLVLALAVMLILSGLALAVIGRTVAAIGSARVAQDEAAAAAAAEAGLADARFALDNGAVATNATFPLTITASGSPTTASTYSWTATTPDGITVDLASGGTVNGRRRQVDAVASRAWPWVVAASSGLVLDGPGSVSGGARLASGGALVLRDGAPAGSGQDLLSPGASCAGCPAVRALPGPVVLPDPVVPAAPLPCPQQPIETITSGTYVCNGDVTFGNDVAVSGAVVLYQRNGSDGTGPPTTLRLAGTSDRVSGGDPANLVIRKAGAGVVDTGDGDGSARITGVLDAPRATLRSDDCQLSVTGALVLGSFACTSPSGGPRLTLDAAAASLTLGAWDVSAHHDAPAGSAP